jgi:glycosyltransferase involved in cell wall biosynthesis
MKWYSKYLPVFEKPLDFSETERINLIRANLKKLQSDNPLVSVVVIAHNEEQRLLACLWSLSESLTSYPIEIIGVDNNSSDRTAEIYEVVGIPWYFEEKKGPGYARSCGSIHAKGRYYVCIDSDTIYPQKYIETLVSRLHKKGVVAVSSLWSFMPDERFPAWKLNIFEFSRDLNLLLQSFKRPELCVRGMVFAYNHEYGKKAGYRCDIIRGEDGMMAFELKQYGKIDFIWDRKARAITSNSMLYAQGGLFNAYIIRVKMALTRIRGYFVKSKEYKNMDSNLIKK